MLEKPPPCKNPGFFREALHGGVRQTGKNPLFSKRKEADRLFCMGNRIIKESIRTSRTVNAMTDFQFRVWVYLITYVDDYGRGSADVALIKGFVFPRRKRVTESDIEKTLAELAGMGCISLYEVDGESYFCFPSWGEHQRIQTKKSKFPAPEDAFRPPAGARRDSPESTANHRESPRPAVDNGEPPPETEYETEYKTEFEYETENELPPGRAAAAGAAQSFFLNRIDPTASMRTLAELERFEKELGTDVCIRAIQTALDAGKPKWTYIRGILKNKQEDGVRSLEDWDRQEAGLTRKEKNDGVKTAAGGVAAQYGVQPDLAL